MTTIQLAIRFSERQIQTLDALATERHSTRTAVVKDLIDQAERARVSALYTAAYDASSSNVDAFGDLDALHVEAESERVTARASETSW